MEISILLTLYSPNNGGRVNPIRPLFWTPEWRSPCKPHSNLASFLKPEMEPLEFGETVEAVIQPQEPKFWSSLKLSETLYCCDGRFVLGDAIVICIEGN